MSRRRARGTGSLFQKVEGGPWIAKYTDSLGRRRQHNTKTAHKPAAARILEKLVADAALRRDLVIDPRLERFSTEGRRPLFDHIEAYIASCRLAGLDARHVTQKDRHLRALVRNSGASRLVDLNADALEIHLEHLKRRKQSARSVNFSRQIAVAFMAWCVKMGKAADNPLKIVPKQDEKRDRRRERRPLTDDELGRLIEVARERGREAWYLCAALAGLRKGDMRRLVWGDVDLEAGVIVIRQGKAKRIDHVPIHPQLAKVLQERRDAVLATPEVRGRLRVFPTTVTDATRLGDFLRAGIARREVVTDSDGRPIMLGKGKRLRPKTRIVVEDELGRVVDLHALRTTLGTQLARAGVAPQVAQKIMRHTDYKTTLQHYTVLGLHDTQAAVARIRTIEPAQKVIKAEGTTGGSVDIQPPNCHLMGQSEAVSGNAQQHKGGISGNREGGADRRHSGHSGPKSPRNSQSGRPDSNRQHSAWKADNLAPEAEQQPALTTHPTETATQLPPYGLAAPCAFGAERRAVSVESGLSIDQLALRLIADGERASSQPHTHPKAPDVSGARGGIEEQDQ